MSDDLHSGNTWKVLLFPSTGNSREVEGGNPEHSGIIQTAEKRTGAALRWVQLGPGTALDEC